MLPIGKRQTGADTLCVVMNVPKPSHRFQYYHKVISKGVEESTKAAALEAFTENNGISNIHGAFDGT